MYDHKCEVMSVHWNNSSAIAIANIGLACLRVCACVCFVEGDWRQRGLTCRGINLGAFNLYLCVRVSASVQFDDL